MEVDVGPWKGVWKGGGFGMDKDGSEGERVGSRGGQWWGWRNREQVRIDDHGKKNKK